MTIHRGTDSARGLLFVYDSEREVAAFDHGGGTVDITVAGAWKPGDSVDDVYAKELIFHTVEVLPTYPHTLEALVELARPHFGR